MFAFKVLINDAVKKYLLEADPGLRQQFRKAFEYLENGLWDGGLRIKKLHGLSKKTILEGRLNRGDRILFTLGKDEVDPVPNILIYIWSIEPHDDVTRAASAIAPDNAPFLQFSEYIDRETPNTEIDKLDPSCFTQESIEERTDTESGSQRWFPLDETEWKRLLLYSKDEFEIFLHLTGEQKTLLSKKLPVLVSGTAGSGKTTLSVYFLLRSSMLRSSRIFLTYNRHLRNFCERLYSGLLNRHPDADQIKAPEFLTFKELCMRLVPNSSRSFPPEREMDFVSFQHLFRKHRLADKYDAALVWEEVRSIIKGAKPQISVKNFRRLLLDPERIPEDPGLVAKIREEILAVRMLGIAAKAENTMQRITGLTLTEAASQLEKMLENQKSSLFRALETILHLMEKQEANFSAPLMTLVEYETLGRKRAPAFLHDRNEIYNVACWYQSQLESFSGWDEIDLTRAAIRAIDNRTTSLPSFDFVCCDEVQDFTDLQLSLIIRLPRNPSSIVLAGDPKQIINPSGFRWEEVKGLFYDRGLQAPEVQYLTLNFRCTGSIVALSNALLQLKRKLLGTYSSEKFDEWKFQGTPPFLVEGIDADAILESVRIAGADRAILTRAEFERDRLKKVLGTGLIFTIQEAKGLEFKSVLLWKFCSDSITEDLWKRILNLETAKIHDAVIRHEINLLYVGITRAQQNLILYDGVKGSVIWADSTIGELLYRGQSSEFLQQAWRPVSTIKEWKRQADYFYENGYYKAAAECYRNANEFNRMHLASAKADEKQGNFLSAAQHWEELGEYARAAEAYERGESFAEALDLWVNLGDSERAFLCQICLLESARNYSEAAELWEQRNRFDKAKENWHKAERHDRLAPLYEKEKKYYEAAQSYEASGNHFKAASLYLKIKQYEKAARCYESAGLFREAVEIWRKRKNREQWYRTLRRADDPILFGQFHEHYKEWRNALEWYRKASTPEFRLQMESDLLQSRPIKIARKAIWLTLLGRSSEGAVEWEKAKAFDLAAEAYVAAANPDAAARCFVRQKRYPDAICMYARSEKDRFSNHAMLRSGMWGHIYQNPKNGRTEMDAIADKFRQEGFQEAALCIYTELRNYSKAADCAETLEKPDLAVSFYLKAGDYVNLARYCIRKKLFEKGVDAFESVLESGKQRGYIRDFAFALQDLLDAWMSFSESEQTCQRVVRLCRIYPYTFHHPFYMKVMEKAGEFDDILWQTRLGIQSMSQKMRKDFLTIYTDEARHKEKQEKYAAAGVRYLLAARIDDAARCWQKVTPSAKITHCLEEAGLWDKSLEVLVNEEKWLEAGMLSARNQNPDAAVDFFLKAGLAKAGAEILEREKYFEAACRLYKEAGNQRKVGTMLERMKRFEEAADVWKSLGDLRRFASCLKKAKPRGKQLGMTF